MTECIAGLIKYPFGTETVHRPTRKYNQAKAMEAVRLHFSATSARLSQGDQEMKVRIKNDLCVGHGMCRLACPQIFQLNDQDGHAYVLTQEVPPELEDGVEFAFGSCPEQAIEIFD